MTEIAKQVKVYDNGGETYDRFTVVFKYVGIYPYYAMSTEPTHPWGFCQYGELKQPPGDYLGKLIAFDKLPAPCQKFVENYLKD